MAYKIEWIGKGIITKWSGSTGSREILQFLKEIHSAPGFEKIRFSIHDYLHCEEISFDSREMDIVAGLDSAGSRTNTNCQVAIVGQQSVIAKMIEAYKRLGLNTYEHELFEDINEALQWAESIEKIPASLS